MLRLVLRLLLAAMLLTTAITKALDLPGFAKILDAYEVFTASMLIPVSYLITGIEFLLGIWLLIGRGLSEAAWTAFVLQIFYALWTATALVRGLKLANSGCFGIYWPRTLTWLTFGADLIMLISTLMLYWFARKKRK
jgi:uncharacterized membrane protein YphA (DoxX/SURF4 family)